MAVGEHENYRNDPIIPDSDRLYLNVGGTVFIISRTSLRRYPFTRLGKIAFTPLKELHFDRNPKFMGYILDLYMTGQLHVPRHCCSMSMKCEMKFWEIPIELVSECCYTMFEEGDRYKTIIDDINKTVRDDFEGLIGKGRFCDHVYNTMSHPTYSLAAKIWNWIYTIFVALASIAFVLRSEPSYRYITDAVKAGLKGPLPQPESVRFVMYSVELPSVTLLDTLCWTFFTVEFFFRLAVAPKIFVFLKSKLNIMDIILVISAWFIYFTHDYIAQTLQKYNYYFFYFGVTTNSFKAMRVLRIFTVLYRNEYTKVMLLSLHASAHPLSLLMLAALTSAVLLGALIYLTELSFGEYAFRNVAKAIWFSFETMLSIGLGNIMPTSVPGYIVAVCCGLCGKLLFCMPIAIISESFQEYMIGLGTLKHRWVRIRYLKKQGQKNAFTAIRMFWHELDGPISTSPKERLLTTPNESHNSAALNERSESTTPDERPNSTTPDERPNSTTPDERPNSVALNDRPKSTIPNDDSMV